MMLTISVPGIPPAISPAQHLTPSGTVNKGCCFKGDKTKAQKE